MLKTFAIEAIVMALAASDLVNAVKISQEGVVAEDADIVDDGHEPQEIADGVRPHNNYHEDDGEDGENLAQTSQITTKKAYYCLDVGFQGVMRPWNEKKYCMDNKKSRNEYLFYDDCWGDEDQVVSYCEGDGSLRVGIDDGTGLCIQQYYDTDNVITERCDTWGTNKKQQWDIMSSRVVNDPVHGEHNVQQFKNRATGTCLYAYSNWYYYLGKCNSTDTSQWMAFPKRGQSYSGRMRHEGTGKCLYTEDSSSWQYLSLVDCDDKDLKHDKKLYWTYYDDGVLMNQGSHRCVGPYNEGSVNDEWAITNHCDVTDSSQRFVASEVNGKTTVQLSALKDQNYCLRNSGSSWGLINNCTGDKNSWFKFLNQDEVGETQIRWDQVTCAQGEVSGSFTREITSTKSRSSELNVSVAQSLTVSKGSNELTITREAGVAMADAFTKTTAGSTTLYFDCKLYEDKKAWDPKAGGCMYRLMSTTPLLDETDTINWASSIVKCTPFGEKPKCGPYQYIDSDGSCRQQSEYN